MFEIVPGVCGPSGPALDARLRVLDLPAGLVLAPGDPSGRWRVTRDPRVDGRMEGVREDLSTPTYLPRVRTCSAAPLTRA